MAQKSKYADEDRDALIEDIKARRAAGRKIAVDLRAGEDKLAAALDADDLENGDFDPDAKPVKHESLRNQVAEQPEVSPKPTMPTQEEFDAGTVYKNKSDGLSYLVIRVANDERNRPVKARVPAQASGHPGYFWEGTEEEFSVLFEKA